MSRWIIPKRRTRWIVYIAIIFGFVAACFGTLDYIGDRRLLQNGIRVEGEIRDMRSFDTGKGRRRYEFDVAFRLPSKPGNVYVKTFRIAGSQLPEPVPQQSITIISDKEDPKKSRLLYGRSSIERIVVPISVFLLGILGLLVIRLLDKRNRALLDKELSEINIQP